MGFIETPWFVIGQIIHKIRVRISVHQWPWILSLLLKHAGCSLICIEAEIWLFPDSFLYSKKTQQNQTSETTCEGTPASWDLQKAVPQSEALWGCPAGVPLTPAPHNRMPHWFEEMPPAADGNARTSDNPHLGLTGPNIFLLRNWVKARSSGLCEANISVSTSWEAGLEIIFQKSSLQAHFSKFMESISITEGTLSLPLLEVIMLTPSLE